MLLTQETPNRSDKIVDLMSEGSIHLCEKRSDTGRIRLEGEFGRWDKATANKRFYPKGLWEANIDRLTPSMKSKKVLGELDHPEDGKTSLKRASHVITKLWLDDDGRVLGEAEIIPTRNGKDLEAMLRSGVPIGISSRGYGSVKSNDKGEDVVQSDYRLVTFDFVAEPADGTAYPDVFFEGVEFPMGSTDEDLQKKFEKLVDEDPVQVSSDTLRKEFETAMLSRISDLKEGLREEIRKEMLEDPSVGKAKATVDAILELVGAAALPEHMAEMVRQKDEEIAELQRELKEHELKLEEAGEKIEVLVRAAKSAGYKYHLENLLRGSEDSELIRQFIGDVTEYESTGELTERVEEIREEVESKRLEEQQEYEKIHAAELALKKKNRALSEGLEEAIEVNRGLALKLYAEKRLRNHPEARKIRAVLEHSDLESQEQVDEIIEEFRETEDEESFDKIRARVRKAVGGGRSSIAEEEERPARRSKDTRGYNGLGAPLSELRKLSGIER